jgi:hypothetical protein
VGLRGGPWSGDEVVEDVFDHFLAAAGDHGLLFEAEDVGFEFVEGGFAFIDFFADAGLSVATFLFSTPAILEMSPFDSVNSSDLTSIWNYCFVKSRQQGYSRSTLWHRLQAPGSDWM